MSSAEDAFWVGVITPLVALLFTVCAAGGYWLAKKLPDGRVRQFLLTRIWKPRRARDN
jgi:hypothetical protein